jgi:hypothetical protein
VSKARKELLIGLAVFVPIVAVILLWRPSAKISFLNLRILNDTHRTVTVQPCWDFDCLNINGLPASLLRPGGSVHSSGHFASNAGHEIVVGIRKPGGNPRKFSSCMMIGIAAGQTTGLVRVSRGRPCFTGTEP